MRLWLRSRRVPGRMWPVIPLVAAVVTALGLAGCAPPMQEGGHGATLTVGMHGNSAEGLDPHTPVSADAQEVRTAQLFNGLTRLTPSGKVAWALAVGMHPNARSDVWTVHLRPHVKLHDGSSFGANDVIYSVRRILDKKRSAVGATVIPFVDPDKVVKVNDLTVRFRLDRPYSLFKQVWTNKYLLMVPTGFDPSYPVGTGPFRYVSAEPGRGSTFRRFDGYWGSKAKVKKLKILDLPDRQSEINALRGGQIDVAAQVPPQQANSVNRTPGLDVLESKSNYHLLIGLRTDLAPFDDPRVRTAVRLLVNRKQVVSNAFSGHGSVANDIDIRSDSCPLPDLPQRGQNVQEAKQLLATAGAKDLSFSIATADDQPGMLETAQVVQQNAEKAGVNVRIKKVDTAAFLARWKEWPVSIGYDSSPFVGVLQSSLLPDSGNNISRWKDKKFIALTRRLLRAGDKAQKCRLKQKMETIQYDRGGTVVPAWSNVLTAHNDKVRGLAPSRYMGPVYYLNRVSVHR